MNTASALSLSLVLALALAIVDVMGAGLLGGGWLALGISVALAAVGLSAKRPTVPASRSIATRWSFLGRLASRIALAAVTMAAALLFVEGATRWWYRDVTSTGDFRGYFTRRWMRAAVIHNRAGFRGGDFSRVKAEGVYRIAVIGDSFTYGNGVAEPDRFSNRLQAALGPQGDEVLNFGFPGNNWPEHLRVLERHVLPLDPDFVLLQWFINDIERDADVVARPTIAPLIRNRARHDWLLEQSAFYTLLNAQWTRWMVTRQLGQSYAAYMRRMYGDPNREGSVAAAAQMARFVAAVRASGANMGMVLFPDTGYDLGEGYPFGFLHQRILDTCVRDGLVCLDLRPYFQRVADRQQLWASPLDTHPSSLANEIAASEILNTFAPTWNTRTSRAGRDARTPPP